jgi:hypothetical protein
MEAWWREYTRRIGRLKWAHRSLRLRKLKRVPENAAWMKRWFESFR